MSTRVAPASPRGRAGLPDWAYPAAAMALLVAAWHVGVLLLNIPERLVPTPGAVAQELVTEYATLGQHARVTLTESLIGFGISLAVATPFALLITSSGVVERKMYPLLASSNTVPKIAIAPLMVIFFGFGMLPPVAIAVLITFFPMVISTVDGLKSVPTELRQLARSMGAGPLQTLLAIRLPHALPSMFAGLKISAALAVTGAVIGEFVASYEGLGYVLVSSAQQYQSRQMFAAIVILLIMGLVLFLLVEGVERRLLRWHVSFRRDDVNAGF